MKVILSDQGFGSRYSLSRQMLSDPNRGFGDTRIHHRKAIKAQRVGFLRQLGGHCRLGFLQKLAGAFL